jgi:predicted RecB family endonuclease
MTDEQIKKLAKQLAEELLKQLEIKQLDELFTESLNDPYELLIAELARLMTLMTSYEESEQYEKAAIIKNKIDRLQRQIEKL